jgi:hypothetical protein
MGFTQSERDFDISLLSTLRDNMGKSLDDLAYIDEVDLLVGTMDVRLRSTNTQSNDLGSGVFALKLFKEGNGSTLTKGSDLLSLEVLL